ncbi:MAG TPA: OmpA family protein [Bacteroidia bacterium]|nr:OmpA family protein [Bacteroidia bacterium]
MKRLIILLLLITGGKLCMAQNETQVYLQFETDKYTLTKNHQLQLDNLFTSHPASLIESITVTGHTDWAGSNRYNQQLSQKRAAAVNAYLNNRWKISASQSFFGEEKPLADNARSAGRSRNRRVEITLRLKPVIKSTETVVEEKASRDVKDTLYTSPNGAQVYIAGDCLPDGLTVNDIEIKVTEALTPTQMRATGTTTRDANGNCLISGGMIYLSVTNKKTGKPIEKLCDTGLIVRIPAPSPDPSMNFYLSDDKGRGWKTTDKGKMNIEKVNGKSYYSFSGIGSIGGSIGFNPDKLPPVAAAPVIAMANFMEKTIYKNWKAGYVKTKGLKSRTAYVSGDSSVLDANYVTKKIITADNCGCIPENQQVISVYGSRVVNGKVQYYVYNNYRGELKERRFFGLFGRRRAVIRRKDWIVVNSMREVQDILAKAPGSAKPK